MIEAWSGATLDTFRNRLIIWGGGHNDYRGNELYAFDMNSFSLERITDPSTQGITNSECVDRLPDGKPSSRHSYGGLAYIAHADRLFAYGGSRGCGSGSFGRDTWTFDFRTMTWHYMQPSGNNPGQSITASAYDPVTKKVFVRGVNGFYAYDFDSNNWELLSNDSISGFGMASGVIDPKRRKFVVVGPGGVHLIDLDGASGYKAQPLSTTGPKTIINDGRSPGLAYDPVRDRIVAWDGSDRGSTPDTVYALDVDTGIWSAKVAQAGPRGHGTRGTFGRWEYVSSVDAFVTVNSVDENAFLFRFSDTGATGDATAPDVATSLEVL